MTLASIDWFRAAVDVAAIFATGLLCQWWGWRQGYQRGYQEGAVDGVETMGQVVYEQGWVPDRDDERLP